MRDVLKSRRLRWALALLAALVCSWLVLFVAPLPFAAPLWRVGESHLGDTLKLRHRMADMFLLSHRLVGLSQGQVVSLLGEPPEAEYFRGWDMVYRLGTERSLIAIDSEWLVIKLDSKRNVANVAITRD
jgi:hypothetical protein